MKLLTLLKILAWIPAFGILIETYIIKKYNKHYMSNYNNLIMFYGSMAYHCTTPLMSILLIAHLIEKFIK
jgi:hypothetical protein